MGKADVEPASQAAGLAEGQRSKEKTLQIQVSHRDGEEGEGGQDNTRWGVGEPLRGGASRLRQDGKEPRAAAGRSLQASVGCLGSRQEEERSRDSAPDAAPGETLQGFINWVLCDLTCFQMAAEGDGLQGSRRHGGDQGQGGAQGTSGAGDLEANFLCSSGLSLPALSLFPF